jgi:hypothetical protein
MCLLWDRNWILIYYSDQCFSVGVTWPTVGTWRSAEYGMSSRNIKFSRDWVRTILLMGHDTILSGICMLYNFEATYCLNFQNPEISQWSKQKETATTSKASDYEYVLLPREHQILRPVYKVMLRARIITVITRFPIAIATSCQALTGFIYVNYVAGHEWSSSLPFLYIVFILWIVTLYWCGYVNEEYYTTDTVSFEYLCVLLMVGGVKRCHQVIIR